MTGAWLGGVFSIVIVVTGACTGGGQTSTQPQHSSQPPIGTLTPDTAVLRVAVHPVREANVLTLRLSSIENPMAEDFALIVSVERVGTTSGRTEQAIGGISPYPPSQPGIFTFAIPHRARPAFSDDRVKPIVLIRLRPARQETVLSAPLRVEVQSVTVHSLPPVSLGR
jgi:hypothetical protein